MNKFEISGYIGIEPKIEMTSSGKKRATFTIANRVNKDKTQFIYVQAWDKTAEIIENYGKKGEFIIAEGNISVYERTLQDGRKSSQIQLVLNRIELINTHRPQQNAPQPVHQNLQPQEGAGMPPITDDMLPF